MADEDPTLPDATSAPKPVNQKVSLKYRFLSPKDIQLRKNAKVEEIKTRYAEKERLIAEKEKKKELGIIEKARLRRINKALGTQLISGEAQNFVVEKPLEPNAMDRYEAQQLERKKAIRTQDKFVPVQKM